MVAKSIAIDTETTGSYFHHGCKPFMVTACDNRGTLYCWDFPVDPHTREPEYDRPTVNQIYDTLSEYPTWVFHNAIFDLTALRCIFPVLDFRNYDIHDTMLMAHCHNNLDWMALKGLALQYLGFPEDDEKALDEAVTVCRRHAKKLGWAIADPDHPHLTPLKDKKGKCDFWLPKALALDSPEVFQDRPASYYEAVCQTYAMKDVERTMGLWIFFSGILAKRGDFDQYDQNRKCLIPTYELQERGFGIKRRKLVPTLHRLEQVKEDVRQGLQRLSGIKDLNPRSPPQLQRALFDRLGIEPLLFSDKGNPKTDREAILGFLEEDLTTRQAMFCRRLLTYRKLNTAETYLDSYQRFVIDNNLYSSLIPTGTTTTRYSHKNPNAGNISKQEADDEEYDLTVTFNLREIFGPPKGHLWICIDYAQLQLRIFAHACEDQYLIDAFAAGRDIHHSVACKVFRTDNPTGLQRRAAKNINFGIIFGAGPRKIERMSGIPGSYDLFSQDFPLIQKYIRSCQKQIRKTGYVRTLGGYPLRVQRKTAYKGCNFVVQGTEGEMVKDAFVQISNYCSGIQPVVNFQPIMIIHDEFVFQTKHPTNKTRFLKHNYRSLQEVATLMNGAGSRVGVRTAVDAKITSTLWSDAKPIPHDFSKELNAVPF